MKNKTTFRVLIILAVVLLIGVVGFFLFDGFNSVVNYVFLGKLQLTGQASWTACGIYSGNCRTSCSVGEYEIDYSCDLNVDDKDVYERVAGGIEGDEIGGILGDVILENGITGNAIISSANVCCMSDTCGNDIVGIGEECDDGNTEDGDGCSSECVEEYCGNDVCDVGESCSGCPGDCEGNVGWPVCDDTQVCGEGDFGFECVPYEFSSCGNGQIDAGEECDLDNLNDETCVSLGFDTGSLICKDDCSFDKSGCVGTSGEDPNEDTDSPGSGGGTTVVRKTCSEVNGTCASTCLEGDVNYGEEFADERCTEDYGVSLICCVSSGEESNDTYYAPDSSSGSDSTDDGDEENDSSTDSDISPGGEIGTIENILSASDYLFVKIVVLIVLIFAVFFVMRKFHFSFWEKLTRRILFPASKKKSK